MKSNAKPPLVEDLNTSELAFLRDAASTIEIDHADDEHITSFDDVKNQRIALKHRHKYVSGQIDEATEHLIPLPKKGWTVHAIAAGNYHAFDLIPAILRLIAPATIKTLYVATLSYSSSNAHDLLELLDQRKIRSLTFICSLFFMAHNPNLHGPLANDLADRGHRCLASRIHAKVNALETTDRRHFVFESSANLRACHGIEQFSLTHDRQLYDFHKAWMDSLFA